MSDFNQDSQKSLNQKKWLITKEKLGEATNPQEHNLLKLKASVFKGRVSELKVELERAKDPTLEKLSHLMNAIKEDVVAKQNHVLKLNPSRKKYLHEQLTMDLPSKSPLKSVSLIDLLENSNQTPSVAKRLQKYFHKISMLNLLQFLIVAQWKKLNLLPEQELGKEGYLKNCHWVLNKTLRNSQNPMGQCGWKLAQNNLFSWYHPSDHLVKKCEAELSHEDFQYKNSTLIEKIILESNSEFQSTAPFYRLISELISQFTHREPFRQLGQKIQAKEFFLFGNHTLPILIKLLQSNDSLAPSLQSKMGKFLQNGIHSCTESEFELFLTEAMILWRLGINYEGHEFKSKPSRWAINATRSKALDLLDSSQPELYFKPLQNQDAILEQIKGKQKLDVIVSDGSRFETDAKEIKSWLEKQPEIKKLLPRANLDKLICWNSISQLRNGGVFIYHSNINLLSDQKFQKFKNLLLSKARLRMFINLSDVKTPLELPKFTYIFQKGVDLDDSSENLTKVIHAEGECKSQKHIKALFLTIQNQFKSITTQSQVYTFGPDPLHPFKISIFMNQEISQVQQNHSTMILNNPLHSMILRDIKNKTSVMGESFHIFPHSSGWSQDGIGNQITAVIKENHTEFWPTGLTKTLPKQLEKIHLQPIVGSFHLKPYCLAFLNSKISRYWRTLNNPGKSSPKAFQNQLKLMPFIPPQKFLGSISAEDKNLMMRIEQNLSHGDLSNAMPSIEKIVSGHDYGKLSLLLHCLQKTWNINLAKLGKNNKFFQFPTTLSYTHVRKNCPALVISKLLGAYPSVRSTPFTNLKEIMIFDNGVNLNQFQVKRFQVPVSKSSQTQRMMFFDHNDNSFYLEAPREVVELLSENLNRLKESLYWHEIEDLMQLPVNLNEFLHFCRKFKDTTQSILNQMETINQLKEQICFKLVLDSEEFDKKVKMIDTYLS